MTKWFADNSMKANVDKFQGIILSGGRNNTAIQVSLDDVDIAFVQKIDVLGVCIDGKLNFNEHVCRICSKASAQISALQRLTGLLDYPSRKAIYTSFIASNFNYCPLLWFFTSRESIDKLDKIQERALRFVLKDHISDYCPACRTTLVATRFRVAVICPIIQVPHCIRVFFYFVWFVFINDIFQFYYELCTYCNILDIYLS